MTRTIRQSIKLAMSALVLFIALITNVYASYNSPVGFWGTVSDITKKPSGVMQIYEHDGKLFGRVVAIYRQGGNKPTDRCKRCPGAYHNKPIMCLNVLWNMRKNGNVWSGGRIMDPKKGKVYKCKMTLENNGMKLHVRGYIGFSLLGRTQTWTRLPKYKLKKCKPL